ncbi:Coronin-2B [Nymphon striatum]|nr:Coronin-2B [Nymphon striatum]
MLKVKSNTTQTCKYDINRLISGLMAIFKGVRSSKFRHVWGSPVRKDQCYECCKITKNAHDSYFAAVNPKFLAIVEESAGGGSFIVLPINRTGRVDVNCGRVTGHQAAVLDIKWNPFNDNVIASCSDDCTIKLWYIPDEGLRGSLNDYIFEFVGHRRRVCYVEWHPTAENVLFSAGFDYLIIIWDVGKGEMMRTIDCHSNCIYSMSFNRDGSLLATTSKDKYLRIIEPRSGKVLQQGKCHFGSKASKVVFLGDSGRLMTTGFSKFSDRQWAIWSQQDLRESLHMETIDSSSGILIPYYDHDTRMVYIVGKGDGNIRYYEVVDEAPWCYYLSQYMTGFPQRGMAVMPKRGLDIKKCEILRFYKLHAGKGLCEPISMIVPRKSDQFQKDIYPDTAAPTPSLTADEWLSGKNRNPVLISMKNGVVASTHKPVMYDTNDHRLIISDRNNDKKFQFISDGVKPDYRPITGKNKNEENISPKEMNENTNFRKLQKLFGSGEEDVFINGSQNQNCETITMCDIVASHTLPIATYVTINDPDDESSEDPSINSDSDPKTDNELGTKGGWDFWIQTNILDKTVKSEELCMVK